MTRDLDALESSARRKALLQRETLCKTLGGINCELLTITAPEKGNRPVKLRKKKMGVVITSRVHPGETVGSWMMKGLLEFLLGGDKEAVMLRERCVFKIVPMLNPDGVIQGNYRTGLAGSDLNRRYLTPSKVLVSLI